MRFVRVLTVGSMSLIALALVGCSSSGSDQGAAPSTTSGSAITIKSYKYTVPKSVKPKQKITVRNDDSVAHTVTSKPGSDFDAKVDANATTTFTAPAKPGSYSFICTYHPYMKATLVVK